MRDSGGELLQYRLVMEPRAAQRARHVVRSLLECWRLGGLADDVVSCVSELVANVYEHAAKSATADLSVSWVPGNSLTVEVRDQDSRLPRRRRTAELGVLPLALTDSDADNWRIMQLTEAGRG
ncbi:MAG: ATP-binding protein, partial [Streptosporangiaceae bacterium]